MKPKNLWDINEGKHFSKNYTYPLTQQASFQHLPRASHYARLKRENKTALTPLSFEEETGCL